MHQVVEASYRLRTQHVEAALTNAFKAVDAAFLQQAELDGLSDGTTAVTSIILPQQLLVGHVGDAKALLCQRTNCSSEANAMEAYDSMSGCAHSHNPKEIARGSDTVGPHRPDQALPLLQAHVLTNDHWPGRPDERARLLAAGASITAAGTTGAS